MHWNQIEYARGEVVEVWAFIWLTGTIVGVHVQPERAVRYYVRTSEGVSEYAASRIRRVKQ